MFHVFVRTSLQAVANPLSRAQSSSAGSPSAASLPASSSLGTPAPHAPTAHAQPSARPSISTSRTQRDEVLIKVNSRLRRENATEFALWQSISPHRSQAADLLHANARRPGVAAPRIVNAACSARLPQLRGYLATYAQGGLEALDKYIEALDEGRARQQVMAEFENKISYLLLRPLVDAAQQDERCGAIMATIVAVKTAQARLLSFNDARSRRYFATMLLPSIAVFNAAEDASPTQRRNDAFACFASTSLFANGDGAPSPLEAWCWEASKRLVRGEPTQQAMERAASQVRASFATPHPQPAQQKPMPTGSSAAIQTKAASSAAAPAPPANQKKHQASRFWDYEPVSPPPTGDAVSQPPRAKRAKTAKNSPQQTSARSAAPEQSTPSPANAPRNASVLWTQRSPASVAQSAQLNQNLRPDAPRGAQAMGSLTAPPVSAPNLFAEHSAREILFVGQRHRVSMNRLQFYNLTVAAADLTAEELDSTESVLLQGLPLSMNFASLRRMVGVEAPEISSDKRQQ